MEHTEVKNISQYLDAIRSLSYELLYRGQAEDWPLIPSLARVKMTVFEGILEIEEHIIEKFQQYGHPYFSSQTEQYSDWILLAQHHGLPTRLLDFTTNPLKALYFAVEDETNEEDGVVWAVSEYGSSKFPALDRDKIEFYTPKHINNRITAQESVFAVFPMPRQEVIVLPLEEQLNKNIIVGKITILGKYKNIIKKELGSIGVNKMSIYPGIEGVVQKVKEDVGYK